MTGQLLKWIYDNLRAYQTAGQKLLELSDGFETFQVKWRNWTIVTWGILDEATDVFFAAAWGESRWRSTFAQLIRIDKICSDFMNVLEKLVDPKVVRMQAAAKRRRDEIRGRILDEPLLEPMSSEQ